MTKPLKISEEAAVQMPMKTVASLIALVAIGTWAYFGINEKLNQHSTKLELFEKDLQKDMKAVIVVTATEQTRITRVRARDGVTAADVRARIAAQMDNAEKLKRADYIIYNNGSIDDLRREVEALISRFLKIPPTESNATV